MVVSPVVDGAPPAPPAPPLAIQDVAVPVLGKNSCVAIEKKLEIIDWCLYLLRVVRCTADAFALLIVSCAKCALSS